MSKRKTCKKGNGDWWLEYIRARDCRRFHEFDPTEELPFDAEYYRCEGEHYLSLGLRWMDGWTDLLTAQECFEKALFLDPGNEYLYRRIQMLIGFRKMPD